MDSSLLVSRNYLLAAGFGLIELMIALTLGTVIILGVTTLFSDSSRALNDINRSGRQLENSLYAIDLLAKELALVDYWGEAGAPVDADDPAYGALRAAEVGIDFDQLDVKDQHRVGRNPVAGTTFTVGQVRRDHETVGIPFLHHLQCFRPTGDNPVHGERCGLVALN